MYDLEISCPYGFLILVLTFVFHIPPVNLANLLRGH